MAIIIEAALGFLGVGIPPPTPTWGNMLADSLNAGLVPPWWLVLFPGAAITLTVLAFNLLGDGIRDVARPAAARRGVAGRLDLPARRPGQRELDAAIVQVARSPMARHHLAQRRRLRRGSAPSRRGSGRGNGSPTAG